MIVEIEIFPLRDARQRAAANVGERAVAAFVHPVRQAVNQVFDDAEAVMHNGGAHLQRPPAPPNELRRVAPGRRAAAPRKWENDFWVARDGGGEIHSAL